MEQIAALDPDLILVGFEAAEQEQFDQLAAIAPTVGLLGELQVDDWQAQLDVVAEVTGFGGAVGPVTGDAGGGATCCAMKSRSPCEKRASSTGIVRPSRTLRLT